MTPSDASVSVPVADGEARSPHLAQGSGGMTAVAQILNAAADLIEKPGAWTQETFARDATGRRVDMWSEDAKCFCVSSAIQRVEGRFRRGAWNKFDGLTRQRGFRHMADWNDHPGRTQAEVVAALREAARQASPNPDEGEVG